MKKNKMIIYLLLSMLSLEMFSSCGYQQENSSIFSETNTTNNSSNLENIFEASEGLDYYPINETECAVSVGKALYLEKIVIPLTYKNYQVSQILEEGFEKCTNLKSIIIPKTIKEIGNYAFLGCENLKDIYYGGTIEDWCNIYLDYNPMVYAENFYMLEDEEWYEVTELEIPNTIKEINDGQFYNFNKIEKLILSSSVKTIGNYAFDNCDNLKNVYFNGTVKEWCSISFEDEAANPLTYTDSIYMKNTNNQFYEVTELEIPNTVEEIKEYQFCNFKKLKKLKIQNGTKEIGSYAFLGCDNLKIIEIAEGLTSIGYKAFSKCSNLQKISFPNSLMGFGYEAFSDCTALEYISLSLKDEGFSLAEAVIGDSGSESNVNEIVITGGTKIKPVEFAGFNNLKRIVIPEGITSIGNYAFYNCNNLTDITLPSTITDIGWHAFGNCRNLKNIVIPSSVTYIGEYAFEECDNITIYCEQKSRPSDWNRKWNDSDRPVYWAGEWRYDEKGNPVPLK